MKKIRLIECVFLLLILCACTTQPAMQPESKNPITEVPEQAESQSTALAFRNSESREQAEVQDSQSENPAQAAFTGGINLADEYINAYEKFGHWKDTGVMVKGEAVWNFTVMFLTLWDFLTKKREPDYERFRPQVYHPEPFAGEGFVAPFTDSPMDGEAVGENVYYNLIAHACRYVYITTPYLILDYEMTNALCTAAKSGVDVRIITPHVWDKFMVYMLTQSNYPALLEAGVKIYEYTPGFVHAKSFVVDDELATVGTINLDYRSLYLHFECGCWMYKTSAVMDIKEDLLKTMEECHCFTMEDYRRLPLYRRLGGKLLKLFAPLL